MKRRMRLLEQENEVLRRAAAYLSQANLPKNCCVTSTSTAPSNPAADSPTSVVRFSNDKSMLLYPGSVTRTFARVSYRDFQKPTVVVQGRAGVL